MQIKKNMLPIDRAHITAYRYVIRNYDDDIDDDDDDDLGFYIPFNII